MEKERIKLQVVSLAVILLLSISLILAIIPFTASASPSTTSIEVEKWVKYKGEPDTEYRKKIDDAKVCDTVTFKIADRYMDLGFSGLRFRIHRGQRK
jgi:hypothetical protein